MAQTRSKAVLVTKYRSLISDFIDHLFHLDARDHIQAKQELSTLFGNTKENAAVGITGDVEFVGLEGPTAVVRLTGRFWHEKTTVRTLSLTDKRDNI